MCPNICEEIRIGEIFIYPEKSPKYLNEYSG